MENPTQTFTEKPCASTHHPPPPPRVLSCQAPSLNRQTIQAPFLSKFPRQRKIFWLINFICR